MSPTEALPMSFDKECLWIPGPLESSGLWFHAENRKNLCTDMGQIYTHLNKNESFVRLESSNPLMLMRFRICTVISFLTIISHNIGII